MAVKESPVVPTNPDSRLCRLGIHKMKFAGEVPDILSRHIVELRRCIRCGHPEVSETFNITDG